MTNKIKDIIKGIKGINFRSDTGKIRVREYQGGSESTLGHGSTLSEALMKLKGDHWLDASPTEGDFGFIYKVVDTRDKMSYIGRKQTLYWDKEKEEYSIPSEWECYSGSCKPLASEMSVRPQDFVFYKILNCKDRDEMGYAEHMLIREIFEKKLVTDEQKYFNNVIPKLYRGQVDGVSQEFKGTVSAIAAGL